jgi:pyruvate-formate lyase-activating enzyme
VKREVLRDRPLLLETNGLHGEAMARLKPAVDRVCMDVKLPSTSGLSHTLDEHERFLQVLAGTEYCVKMVVGEDTPPEEVAQACTMIARVDRRAPLILQPVIRRGKIVSGQALLALWAEARRVLDSVRILPQVHKILDVP